MTATHLWTIISVLLVLGSIDRLIDAYGDKEYLSTQGDYEVGGARDIVASTNLWGAVVLLTISTTWTIVGIAAESEIPRSYRLWIIVGGLMIGAILMGFEMVTRKKGRRKLRAALRRKALR
jgi:hypothetical protein